MKIIFASLFIASVFAVVNTGGFQKAIGTSSVDNGKIILNTEDGYIVVGEKSSDDHQRKEILVYKTDKEGNVNWAKSYGGSETYVVNDAYLDSENHIHLSSERYLSNRESLLYMELDESGNLETSVPYDEGGNEVEPWAIAPTENGGNIIVGFTKVADFVPGGFYNASLETKHLYILGMDGNGNKLWSKKLKTPEILASNAFDIIKTEDNHFLIIGNYLTQNEAVNIILKVDEAGTIIWNKIYNHSKIDLRYIDRAENNNYIITGTSASQNNKKEIAVIKINSDGNVIWSKEFGGLEQEKVKGSVTNQNGEVIITGTSKSFNSSSDQILILKLDVNGNLQWANKYGNGVLNEPSNAILDFGNLVFTGFSLKTDNGPETTLIKTTSNNSTQREITIQEQNLNVLFINKSIPFETINETSFSGNYNSNETVVTNLSLNSIDINL